MLLWWGVPVVSILGMFLWPIENYRGERRLRLAKEHVASRMGSWDWREYFPTSGPLRAADNLAAQPPFDLAVIFPSGDVQLADIEPAIAPLFQGVPTEILSGRREDLEALVKERGSEMTDDQLSRVVLDATTHLEPLLDALHAALMREQCQWVQSRYDRMNFAPPSQQVQVSEQSCRQLVALLSARAEAFLVGGMSERAEKEIVSAIKFCEIRRFETGSMTGALMRLSMNRLLPSAELQRLLLHKQWSDSSLMRVQHALGEVDLLGGYDRSVEADLANIIGMAGAALEKEPWTEDLFRVGRVIEPGKPKGRLERMFRAMRGRFYGALPSYMPRGWHGQNGAKIVEWWDQNFLSFYDAKKRLIYPDYDNKHTGGVRSAALTPYNFLAKVCLPTSGSFGRHFAVRQAEWDMLMVVASLRRYFLLHREYPAALDQLVSEGFMARLPHDYVTGEIPFYQADEHGVTIASLDWDRTGNSNDFLCQTKLVDGGSSMITKKGEP